MLKLYDYYRSSACFRVRIALNLKDLGYEIVTINLVKNDGEQHSPEYQQVNPQRRVPSLQDGDKIITQSLAIIEYLDEYKRTPPLLPNDPYEKALVKAFALTIVADIHPLNNSSVLKYLSNEFKISDAQKNTWYHHWIHQGFTALEKRLASRAKPSNFCFGDEPSLADICLAPQIYNARRFMCDISAYPILNRLEQTYKNHPAFLKAWPMEETVKE